MKRLIKKAYYDEPDYSYPDCLDEIAIDEKWFTEAIEYYQNAIKEHPDLSLDELWNLLEETESDKLDYYYCTEPNDDDLYCIYIDIDNTGIKIDGGGSAEAFVSTGYDWSRAEEHGYYQTIHISMEVKYSLEQFMNETPQGIIQDLYSSLEWECR